MVLKKCHFDNLFKKILDEIEETFDSDFELGISYDLEGLSKIATSEKLSNHNNLMKETLWDMEYYSHPSCELERLIKEHIIFLLYLNLKITEEK